MTKKTSNEIKASSWISLPLLKQQALSLAAECGLNTTVDPMDFLDIAKAFIVSSILGNGGNEQDKAMLARGRFSLMISASLGNRSAIKMLADEMSEFEFVEGSEDVGDLTHIQFQKIREVWKLLSRQPIKTKGSHPILPEVEEFHDVDFDALDFDEAVESTPPVTPKTPLGVIVVKTVGDPESGDGKNIGKRYSSLINKPLPLSGIMPAPNDILNAIRSEFPWAEAVAVRIENAFELQRSVGVEYPKLKPLLFVGPPGSGKTSLARRIASHLNLKAQVVAIGGTTDGASLGAVSRGWTGSRPCAPITFMADKQVGDPAIIADEIEKGVQVGNQNGSAIGTLLGMLGTPEAYYDGCLMSHVDLRHVTFMATANSVAGIPTALLDRFQIEFVPRPGEEHFDIVLASMRKRVADDMGTIPEFLPALDDIEFKVLRDFYLKQKGSLRLFERAFRAMLSEALQRQEMGSPYLQ